MMKHVRLLIVGIVFSTGAAQALEVDFSRDPAGILFDDSAKPLPESSDGLILLPDEIETRALTVVPGKKFKLKITAEVAGAFVEELNARAHILTRQSFRNRLSSTYEMVFLDAAGMEIPGLGGTAPGHTPSQRGFFLSNRARSYVTVFHPPAQAVSLKVRFHSNDRSTRIAGFSLTPETEEKTINPNPDFRYGDLSYSGWQPQRDGRLFTRPDGKTVLNVGYGGASPFFPLSPETTYRVSAVGESPEGKGSVTIHYYDTDGKSIRSSFLFRPVPLGVESELVPPPGTAMGRVVMYGGLILEEFKVVPMK